MQSNDIELEKIDEFADLRNKRVLEVGCGDGRLSSFLAQKTVNLTAIDIDQTRLEDARRMIMGVDWKAVSKPLKCAGMAYYEPEAWKRRVL